MENFKLAGQSIDDVCLSLLRDYGNDLRSGKIKIDPTQQQKLLSQVQTAYNGLFATRYQNTPERADKFKKALDFITKNAPPEYSARVTNLRGMLAVQPVSGAESTKPVRDETEPNYLKFRRVDFSKSTGGQYIISQLGQWTKQKPIPKSVDSETLILANTEPWELFRQLSANVFHNEQDIPTAQKLGLEPLGVQKTLNSEAMPIQIQPLNTPSGQSYWNIHKQKSTELPKGIRIVFQPQDQNFWKVRDHIAKGEGAFKDARISNNTIDIYELDPYKLQKLSKQLSSWGYGKYVGPLNDLMQQFTGKSYGQIEEEAAKDVKNQPLRVSQINNGIDRNLGTDGHTQLITANLPFDDAFKQNLSQSYPNVFDAKRWAPQMIEAQQKGVHFMLTRQSSVEADSPGAGKTAQAVTFADLATKMWSQQTGAHQKVLVFTPPQLIDEHWVTDVSDPDPKKHKYSKPIQYLGEQNIDQNGQVTDNVLIVRNFDDWQKANQSGAINSKKWVVVPYSALGMTSEAQALSQALSEAVRNRMFATSLADELQMQKDISASAQDASYTLKNMDLIFSGAMAKGGQLNLPHRVAMSGTPADNSPADMYSIMRATRHPVIYNDFTTQQYQEGFVKQIMGMDDKSLDRYKETDNNPERGDQALDALVQWARSTTPEARDANLRLFGETFIRRTKEQIRPDMPPKAPRERTEVNTGQQWPTAQGPGAKQTQDRQMALAKVPTTASTASQYLQQNSGKKVFIVSYYPEVVNAIAQQINDALGDGTAVAVSGQVTKGRGDIARAFQENLPIVGNTPFRAACYTLGVGAVGLNFKTASRVIFNDIDWVPSKNLQAEDRIWRIDMPAGQIAERQYMVIPNSRDAEKFNRVMQKEKVNEKFHAVLQSVSAGDQQRDVLADNFLLEVMDEMMFSFNRDSAIGQTDPQTGQVSRIPLDQMIQAKKHELLQYFASQRAGTKRRAKPRAVAASNNWYQRALSNHLALDF